MSTRSKTRETSLGHVLQCDIEENLTSTLVIRKHNKWFYLSVVPDEIKNGHLRGQYERRANAARQQHEAYQDYCNGESEGKDSGYVSDDDSENAFGEWIQQPLKTVFSDNIPTSKKSKISLHDWYQAEILCMSLTAMESDKDLQVIPREDLDGEAFLKTSIVPNMTLPKYIRSREELKWYSPKDIEVLDEAHNIHMPIHPTLVRAGGQDLFLKLVSKAQEPAVKREIKFLLDFKEKGLYEEGIRAPTLEGVVTLPSSPGSHDKILGFLLSLIPQPCTPLTRLMSSEISETKRKAWAVDVERQISILHKHKLLWGDAKADNFLVDRKDRLWIIDFGGSFTVGWMDPEKYGTQRGEDEAVQLIVNGVKDPDHCTEGLVGETDEKPPSQSEEARNIKTEAQKAKRKHEVVIDDSLDRNHANKKAKCRNG